MNPIMQLKNKKIMNQVTDIESICARYGFLDNVVMLYDVPVTVKALINNWKGYADCTKSAQTVILSEMHGFRSTLDTWMEHATQPMVRVQMIDGPNKNSIKEYPKDAADIMIQHAFARAI
jgi:hypothetical protein